MADNVTLPGIDTVVAADDCGGVLVQRMKIVGGADGVLGPGLAIDENGAIPVTLPTGDLPVAVQGTVPVSIASTLPVAVQGTVPISAAVNVPVSVHGTVPVSVAATLPVTVENHPASIEVSNLPAAPAVLADGSLAATVGDLALAVRALLEAVANPLWVEPNSGRVKVLIDALGGAQTLGTVTTCSTVTNVTSLNALAAVPANSVVYDLMDATWADCVREGIS